MGRPLNKRFFGIGSGKVACIARIGGSNVVAHIVSQRSNTKYLVAETASPSNDLICTLVDKIPTINGEVQVTVQPENAQSIVQATVDVTAVGGAITVLTVNNAGYGYWANNTNVAVVGGTAGTADYTVDGNGSLATVSINNAGSAYADGPAEQNINTPAANPPLQNARIINAKTVKTFGSPGGTFTWPIIGTDDGAGPSGRGEADLNEQA